MTTLRDLLRDSLKDVAIFMDSPEIGSVAPEDFKVTKSLAGLFQIQLTIPYDPFMFYTAEAMTEILIEQAASQIEQVVIAEALGRPADDAAQS